MSSIIVSLIIGNITGIFIGWFTLIHVMNSEKGKKLIRESFEKEFTKMGY